MTDEEIKSLLRDLAAKAETEGKSKTVRIRLDKEDPDTVDEPVKKSRKADEDDDAAPKGSRVDDSDAADAADDESAGRPARQSRRRPFKFRLLEWIKKKREEVYLDEPDADEPELGEESEDGERRFLSKKKSSRSLRKEKAGKKAEAGTGDEESFTGDEPQDEPQTKQDEGRDAAGKDAGEVGHGASGKHRDHIGVGPDGKDTGDDAGDDTVEGAAGDASGKKAEEDKPEAGSDEGGKKLKLPGFKWPKKKASSAGDGEEKKADEDPDKDRDPEKGAEKVSDAAAGSESGKGVDKGADKGADKDTDKDADKDAEKDEAKPVFDDHPIRGSKGRKTPVEEADFESDAVLFEDEDAQESEPAGPPVPLKERFAQFYASLKARGITGRELLMIAAGLLLLVLIAAVVMSAMGNRRKMENVTADEGLTVTVEEEPQDWCSHGPVTLGIRTSSPIQSITVNEKSINFAGKERTKITLDADSNLLDIMVVTEDKVLGAQAEVPFIDTEEPVVTVSVENSLATLEAVDGRSGLAAVYYGETWGLSNVPFYQQYTGPFKVEPGKLYSCYAVDVAGNMTRPMVTDMKEATALVVTEPEISLFPGESAILDYHAEPANGFVNELEITSSDESVVSVDQMGNIRALANGNAIVEVSAKGLDPASCLVTVQSEAEITLSAIGDLTLGDDENFYEETNLSAYYEMYGPGYFFENVRDVFAADDVTFANMEGPLTKQGTREIKEFAFRGDPAYTQILTDGSIDVVTLANNHSADYGEVSLTDTQKYLTEAGIPWCMEDHIAYKSINGVKIGFVGIYVLDEGIAKTTQTESSIKAAKAAGADIVAVAFHWGSELATEPDETQKALAHLAIDCGADLVVGHHPHVLQGIEIYKDKYIVYSLGNFCFGGNTHPTDMDTMIFQQTFTVSQDRTVSPGAINIVPCSVSSTADFNDYRPTRATGSEATRILDKVRTLSNGLGTSLQITM